MRGESFAEYVRARRTQIDDALARFLPGPPACPAVIADAMRYSVFAGGKRLRPVLTLAAADTVTAGAGAQDIARALALPAACAIEFIHTYSLIHDDLPAMDDDTLRRGMPTLHVVHGEGIAILAGDGLLTEAFLLMAREPRDAGQPDLAARRLRVLETVARAAGPEGMVGGQGLDLQAVGAAGTLPGEALEAMYARKTGAMIRASAAAGAIMAGADDRTVVAIDDYAAHLGLAFQIVDDILDVEGAAEELGKTAGKDAEADKPTYPALYGVERSRELAANQIDRALSALETVGLRETPLADIAEWVVSRTN
jgi:geranylgeranyl diphosphate synthase, type II